MRRPISTRWISPAPLAALAVLLAGCGGPQSALSTGGPVAGAYAILGHIMFAGAAAILVLVMGLAAYAMLAPPGARAWLGRRHIVMWGGVAFPILTLSVLLVYGLWLTREAQRSEAGRLAVAGASDGVLRIEVVGEQFWWRVRYLDETGGLAFETANEIRIPTGRPIALALSSADVLHSFWVPSLAGKLDMIPGRVTTLTFNAAREGVYRGQCAEYCGAQHARMAFYAIAVAPERFSTWMAGQRQPAPEPRDALLRRGLEVFLSSGCGTCHTIRGTAAAGKFGPDLTSLGGRTSLAAGTFPNNAGTIAGWIASSQHLKPGNLMPSFDALDGLDLRAVATYLESLK